MQKARHAGTLTETTGGQTPRVITTKCHKIANGVYTFSYISSPDYTSPQARLAVEHTAQPTGTKVHLTGPCSQCVPGAVGRALVGPGAASQKILQRQGSKQLCQQLGVNNTF